jgi:hypothetical protein
MITTISEYISYKMTPTSQKDYRASNITTFILSTAWTTSTGNDRRRDLPSIPLLARTGRRGTILLLHQWQWKASLSRLMVATQQGGGNHDMGALDKEASLLVDLQKAVVVSYAKLLWLMPKALLLKTRHWTYHRVHCGSSTKAQDWPTPNIPTIPTQVTLIVQGSMPLMTMSTTVMTVLHSVEVVHIPHGPRLSLVAKHPLIWRNTLTHIWGVR